MSRWEVVEGTNIVRIDDSIDLPTDLTKPLDKLREPEEAPDLPELFKRAAGRALVEGFTEAEFFITQTAGSNSSFDPRLLSQWSFSHTDGRVLAVEEWKEYPNGYGRKYFDIVFHANADSAIAERTKYNMKKLSSGEIVSFILSRVI